MRIHWAFLAGAALALAGPASAQPADKDLFGLGRLWQFHLELSAKDYQQMQPLGGKGFPGPFGPKPAPAAERPADVHKPSTFGLEYPWVKGDFTADGKTFKNVGVRYKGNFTYISSANQLKRPLKIDLDHYGNDQRLRGQRKVNLGNGAADPQRLREPLAFAVFRAAGVPAPRTAFAELTLTVPGKYDKEPVGLYTVIEQVDKTFLKAHFKNGKGLLLKPEGLQGGLQYLGDDWAPYEKRYLPKYEATKKQKERLIAFARLINKADDEKFAKEIGDYLDIDAFLRFVAVNALIVNLDSYLGYGHNYYLYLRPDTERFVFIPWDLDWSFGTWPAGGTSQQQVDLSINRPYSGQNKLLDRLLANKDVNEKYQKVLRELSTTCFTKDRLLGDIDTIEKAAKEPLAREKKAIAARKEGGGGFGMPGGGMFGKAMDLRAFIDQRTASVTAQLDGKKKGFVPTAFGFGPGGPGPGGPGGPGFGGPKGGFGPGVFWAKPLREGLDADKDGKVTKDELVAGVKKFFDDSDKDKTGALDEKALVANLNRVLPGMAFAKPGGGPKGNFGPGNTLAGLILKRADADKDGKLTKAELVTAAEALFREADRAKKGSLDEPALAAGINLLFPPPPAFGPPGGPPFRKMP